MMTYRDENAKETSINVARQHVHIGVPWGILTFGTHA